MNLRRSGWMLILLVSYLALFATSYLIQNLFPVQKSQNKYEFILKTENASSGQLSISYLELNPVNHDKKVSLLLFPDIYYGPEFLLPIAENLSRDRRIIIPIFSETLILNKNVFDHTINSKIRIAENLINAKQLDSLHIAGHGFGAAVAIKYHDVFPDKNISLTLLSGVGVKELNYLGSYTLNKLLFTFLKPATRLFEYLIPHFGWYYNQPVQSSFAEDLAVLDLREHRNIIEGIDIPVNIIHSNEDRYVPIQMADEHYRIIPQSRKTIIDGFHKSIFEKPRVWSKEIEIFLSDVEEGNAAFRTNAPESRIIKSNEPFDSSEVVPFTGWIYFLILILIAVSSIINEDISGIGGGLLAARGLINFWDALFACMVGVILFDIFVYWLGRLFGSRVIRKLPFRWFINEEDIQKAEKMFDLRGMEILFAAKFIPGTRFPTYFSAGLLRNNFLFFILYFLTSVFIWAPIIVGVSMIAGQTLLNFFQSYQDYFAIIAIASGVLIFFLLKFILPMFTMTGRRKLAEKLKRKQL